MAPHLRNQKNNRTRRHRDRRAVCASVGDAVHCCLKGGAAMVKVIAEAATSWDFIRESTGEEKAEPFCGTDAGLRLTPRTFSPKWAGEKQHRNIGRIRLLFRRVTLPTQFLIS